MVPCHAENGADTLLEVPPTPSHFRFLGHIQVVYLNPGRLDTWSEQAAIASVRIFGAGKSLLHTSKTATLTGEWAERIRDRDPAIARVEVSFRA
jgi:hypothetical protein